MNKTIDIYSKGDYPADVLSNFYPNEFVIDGVRCGGMEGFLQSLKFKSRKKQDAVAALSGKDAKERRTKISLENDGKRILEREKDQKAE